MPCQNCQTTEERIDIHAASVLANFKGALKRKLTVPLQDAKKLSLNDPALAELAPNLLVMLKQAIDVLEDAGIVI